MDSFFFVKLQASFIFNIKNAHRQCFHVNPTNFFLKNFCGTHLDGWFPHQAVFLEKKKRCVCRNQQNMISGKAKMRSKLTLFSYFLWKHTYSIYNERGCGRSKTNSFLNFVTLQLWAALHKICENTGFRRPVFSHIGIKSTILPLYWKKRVSVM